MAAGLPESTMYSTLLSSEVTHLTSSTAWLGYLVYSPIARLIPPSGGLLGSPAITSGYRAQRDVVDDDWRRWRRSSASPLAAPYT